LVIYLSLKSPTDLFEEATFTEDALALIIRSCDGILRKARNLCLSCMIEALRKQKKIIGIEAVNSVLIQPRNRIEKNIDNLHL